MAIPYVIILSDSEDELDHAPATIVLSDSDNESYHSVPFSPQLVHVFNNDEEEEPEEEDPEEEPEEDPSEHEAEPDSNPDSSASPPTYWTHLGGGGAHIIHTARKRVAIPRRRATPSPEPAIPTTDPYFNPTAPVEGYEQYRTKNWTWLADTLQEWRNEEGFPTITEVGESSTTRQEYPYTKEPPHHTIPLLVARMSSQELRIEHAENNIMGMPESEAFEDLQAQVTNLGQHIEGVRDATTDLRQRGEESASRTVDLERRMDHLERSLEQLQVMAATMGDYAAYILKGEHAPKKSG